MQVYPQLPSGALSQFPVKKLHQVRTLVNTSADGRAIKLADPGAETVEWQLRYTGLSDVELGSLQQFFATAEGSLNSFLFLDPTANLLAWSSDLVNAAWAAGPMLTTSSGVADVAGGTSGWHMANAGAGAQQLTQTISAPGRYVYSFSMYLRSEAPSMVTLLLGDSRSVQPCGPTWRRASYTGTGDPSARSMTFGVEFTAGASIDVYGPQVEPQASPSIYKASSESGVYEDARFKSDSFTFTSTDVNRHNATVNIIHASHL